jgi:hypothetical protein
VWKSFESHVVCFRVVLEFINCMDVMIFGDIYPSIELAVVDVHKYRGDSAKIS